jgi:DNA replication and repair protein RecF
MLKQLDLSHFRCFNDLSLDLSAPLIALTGKNGCGKSAVLEAIALLTTGRSYRAQSDKDWIAWGQRQGHVSLTLQSGVNLAVNASLTETDRVSTRFSRNEVRLATRSAILGSCPSVTFFLSDLDIARSGPEHRRRWLDSAITQLQPAHLRHLSAYEQVRKQKAALLKTPQQTPIPTATTEQLAVWNTQLIHYGALILQARQGYCNVLAPLVSQAYAHLAPAQEALTLTYHARGSQVAPALKTPATEAPPATVDDWSAALQHALTCQTQAEWQRGVCLVGPHRDDITLSLNGHEVTHFGSQGQQRSVVLALKHAEREHLHQYHGVSPLLLLDDVMAELDKQRQAFILQWFTPDSQVVLTTTHLSGLPTGVMPLLLPHEIALSRIALPLSG